MIKKWILWNEYECVRNVNYKANKAAFSKTTMMDLTNPLDLANQTCSILVIDSLHGEVETESDLPGDC